MQSHGNQRATDQSGRSAGPYPLTCTEPPRELEIHNRVNCSPFHATLLVQDHKQFTAEAEKEHR